MFRDTLRLLILSVVLCMSHEDEGVFTNDRDYFSKKLFGNIDLKFRHIGLFNPVGISYFLKRAPEYECNMTFFDNKILPTAFIMLSDELKNPPNLTWPSEKGHYYTLYMGDLDTKLYMVEEDRDYNEFEAYCIWLVGNIPGNDVQKGNQIFPYDPPRKPRLNEIHRHLILIYDQQHPEPIDFEGGFVDKQGSAEMMNERFGLRIDGFAEHYNFGDPWAGNMYFVCESK